MLVAQRIAGKSRAGERQQEGVTKAVCGNDVDRKEFEMKQAASARGGGRWAPHGGGPSAVGTEAGRISPALADRESCCDPTLGLWRRSLPGTEYSKGGHGVLVLRCTERLLLLLLRRSIVARWQLRTRALRLHDHLRMEARGGLACAVVGSGVRDHCPGPLVAGSVCRQASLRGSWGQPAAVVATAPVLRGLCQRIGSAQLSRGLDQRLAQQLIARRVKCPAP